MVFLQDLVHHTCIFLILHSCLAKPFNALLSICCNTYSLNIAKTKEELCLRMSLYRRFTKPFHSLARIQVHTLCAITQTETTLCLSQTLRSRFLIPFNGLAQILFYTFTTIIASA